MIGVPFYLRTTKRLQLHGLTERTAPMNRLRLPLLAIAFFLVVFDVLVLPAVAQDKAKAEPKTLQHKGLGGAAYSPDGRYLATASFDAIRIWDLKDDKEISQCVPQVQEDPDNLYSTPKGARDVAFSKDGKVLFAHNWRTETANLKRSLFSTVFVFDRNSGKQVRYFDLGESGFVTFSADGDLLAYKTIQSKHIDLRKSDTGQPVHQFDVLKLRGTDVPDLLASTCISTDNKRLLLAGGYGRLYSLEDGKQIRVLQWPDKQFQKAVLLPDGKRALIAFKDKLVILNTDSERDERVLEGNIESMWSMAVSPDGKLALGAARGHVILWNLESGKQVTSHTDIPANVTSVSFSPNGDTYAVCARNAILIYPLPNLPEKAPDQVSNPVPDHRQPAKPKAAANDQKVTPAKGTNQQDQSQPTENTRSSVAGKSTPPETKPRPTILQEQVNTWETQPPHPNYAKLKDMAFELGTGRRTVWSRHRGIRS